MGHPRARAAGSRHERGPRTPVPNITVLGYLKRLVTAGLAYQAGDILSKGAALFTLPLYTHYVSRTRYGYAEALLTGVILALDRPAPRDRRGVHPLLLRRRGPRATRPDRGGRGRPLRGDDGYRRARRRRPRRAALARAARPRLRRRCSRSRMLGIWAFTNLEIAYALLRADERNAHLHARLGRQRRRSRSPLMVWLVVCEHDRRARPLARQLRGLDGVLFGLWWAERGACAVARAACASAGMRAMLDFGLPTVPADASVYALQVADRWYLLRAQLGGRRRPLRARGEARDRRLRRRARLPVRLAAARLLDRGRRGRGPALRDRHDLLRARHGARRRGRRAARRAGRCGSSHHAYFGAHRALPWLALGWALYGLYLIFVVISGRARRTRRNLPAALVGLAVNVGCAVRARPPLRYRRRRHRARDRLRRDDRRRSTC